MSFECVSFLVSCARCIERVELDIGVMSGGTLFSFGQGVQVGLTVPSMNDHTVV